MKQSVPRIRIGDPVLSYGAGVIVSRLCARQLWLAAVLYFVALVLAACASPATPTPQVRPSPSATLALVVAPTPTATILAVPQSTPAAPKPQASLIPAVDSEWLIVVRRGEQKMVLYRGGQEQKSYSVSTGKTETTTPLGWWKIVEKYPVDPPGIYGTRWLGWQRWNPRSGLYEWYKESPPFGIHGTNEPERIGAAVSLGCVRLQNRDVEEVYETIPIGTYVLVVD
jgi:lipoprotein-anchoring transpeptidase ErfK/SrfK